MKAVESTFSSLFQTEGNQWHFHIPKYQREYCWGKYNWGKLIEDIYENEAGHYMGSVICVHDKEELAPNSELIYEVVDGQQRLTTLSLLLMAIYYIYKFDLPEGDANIVNDDDYKDTLNNIRKKLIKKIKSTSSTLPVGAFKDGSNFCFLRVQPSGQYHNLEDYKYILFENELIEEVPYPKNCGNRSIYKAYCYFYDQIPKDWASLDDLIDRINRLNFIHISEASQSKAFILFETLNYRGVPLSAIDIIKNKMLSVLELKHNVNIDDSFEKWQKLLGFLPDQTTQDRFLRQYYNAFKYDDRIKVERVPKATSSTLIKIYETIIKKDANWIFDELISKAKIYHKLIEAESYPVTPLTEALVDLERISASPSYTFLLYLLSLDKPVLQSEDMLLQTVQLLSKYYFRRNITDFPNTRDLDVININLIEQCQEQIKSKGKLDFSFIEQTLLSGKGKPSPISNLKDSIKNNLFYNNDWMARYCLAKLDETSHTREYKPDLWARNEKGSLVWTVEHIFPQGKNIPKHWVEMIAGGDREKAKDIQDNWVDCLGNLTLSGYNSVLSNHSFEKKQTKSDATILGTKIKIGYQNGMALNNFEFSVGAKKITLANAPKWTQEMIESRNNVLADMLVKLFSFKGENV